MSKKSLPEDRRTLDINISNMDFVRYKSMGIKPYFVDTSSNNKIDMVELTKPVKQDIYNKPREVFLLTPEEFSKIKKLSDNINEMIELKLKQIELYKKYIPSVAAEITKKK